MSDPEPATEAREEPATPEPLPDPTPEQRGRTWVRLGLLALAVVVSVVVADQLGVTEWLSRDHVRELIVGLGPLGVVAFVGLFVVGELAHVPGWVFIGASILAYGRVAGGLVGYAGALVAIAVAFFVVRMIGGQALATIRRPFVARMLARVDEQPIRTVAVLRIFLVMTPALTYALALTRIRFREYMIGSALGLVVPIALMSLLFDWLFAQ